ncbi:hypothetical protein KNP414_02403 [Paenibacillus mucilaginosus KNP414]|uniref:Uncharacterized protein n=1 Tax=Paenibacillus mucilaginosus (strain KNP414) TaxID=1036673 RepID=F8F5F3_PAEMK|nr:hypothetical protein KNP414_02403 [Paenibacillus mucilaginosus KNP414]
MSSSVEISILFDLSGDWIGYCFYSGYRSDWPDVYYTKV